MTHAAPFDKDPDNNGTTSHAIHFGAAPIKVSLWDRIFGVTPGAQPGHTQRANPAGVAFELAPREAAQRNDEVPQMAVWVTKPARTPLEAFKDTISEGTRLFCEQNVHPLYVEDHQTKFRVTGVKMYVPKGDSQLTSILEELPIEVRNRLARLRAQSAPGASEQLVFDEGFFGISIDIEPAVIEGQQIRLIAAWSGGSVDIKMVFTGQYITVKTKQEPKAIAQAPINLASSEPASQGVGPAPDFSTTSTEAVLQVADRPYAPPEPACPSPQEHMPPVPTQSKRSKDTPLGLPVSSKKSGTDTPMSTPADMPIGLIRVLPFGAQQETVISITAKMLPFMLGREHKSSGRFTNGYSMVRENDETVARLVSREHFELNHFERDERRFYVINHAVEKNGSYYNGCNVPERFSFKALAPKNTFTLGGVDGEGTVRIVIEAV